MPELPTTTAPSPVAPEAPEHEPSRRIGCLAGRAAIPDDFDVLGQDEIEATFGERETL